MLNKKNIGRAFGVSLATIYATLIAETIYDICPGMHVWLVWLIFICLFTGLYCAGFGALVDRPAELDRKFPTSSKDPQKKEGALRLAGFTRTALVPPLPRLEKRETWGTGFSSRTKVRNIFTLLA